VVAEEIRALSERTRQETESISRILETLEENANDTAKAVGRSVEVGNVQENMIGEVAKKFEEMHENVQELVSDIHEIEHMLDDLSTANTDIVNHITYLSATTEEVTASAIQSSEITETNFRNSQDAKDILDGIIQVSHGMDRYIQ
jgi:methyl-accepting chemotaxis protein